MSMFKDIIENQDTDKLLKLRKETSENSHFYRIETINKAESVKAVI